MKANDKNGLNGPSDYLAVDFGVIGAVSRGTWSITGALVASFKPEDGVSARGIIISNTIKPIMTATTTTPALEIVMLSRKAPVMRLTLSFSDTDIRVVLEDDVEINTRSSCRFPAQDGASCND